MPCPRCSTGRMFRDDGDMSCFACGHVVYGKEPMDYVGNEYIRILHRGGFSMVFMKPGEAGGHA